MIRGRTRKEGERKKKRKPGGSREEVGVEGEEVEAEGKELEVEGEGWRRGNCTLLLCLLLFVAVFCSFVFVLRSLLPLSVFPFVPVLLTLPPFLLSLGEGECGAPL